MKFPQHVSFLSHNCVEAFSAFSFIRFFKTIRVAEKEISLRRFRDAFWLPKLQICVCRK